MKKLMIAAAIVCAAAMSQAASFAWSAEGLVADTPAGSVENYIAYGFYKTGDGTTVDVQTYTVAEAIALVMGSEFPSALDEGGYVTIAGAGDAKVESIDEGSGVASGTAQGFMIIVNQDYDQFDESGIYAPTKYSVIEGGSLDTMTITKAGDSKTFKFGASEQGEWQSVPEPTSGLLLLLGMAGLALKRKRA